MEMCLDCELTRCDKAKPTEMSNKLQELLTRFNHYDFHTDRALDGNFPKLNIQEFDIYTKVNSKNV